MVFSQLVTALVQKGDMVRAKKTLDYCDKMIPTSTVNPDYYTTILAEAYYKTGNIRKGDQYMFIDANGNGKWDTGELTPRKHPERVYYYPQKMTLIANWEFEESWDYLSVPLTKQKPLELDKNYKKPNDNSKQNNKSGSNNNNNSGTGNNSNTGNSKNNMVVIMH